MRAAPQLVRVEPDAPMVRRVASIGEEIDRAAITGRIVIDGQGAPLQSSVSNLTFNRAETVKPQPHFPPWPIAEPADSEGGEL